MAGKCHRTTATPSETFGASPPRPARNSSPPAASPGASSSTPNRTSSLRQLVTPRRARAIFTRRFALRKRSSCRCFSSSRTTPMGSAARRARSTRSRSMSFSLTTGGRSMGRTLGWSTKPGRKRSRTSARARDRSFSGSTWSGFPVTPARMITSFIAARRRSKIWRRAIP